MNRAFITLISTETSIETTQFKVLKHAALDQSRLYSVARAWLTFAIKKNAEVVIRILNKGTELAKLDNNPDSGVYTIPVNLPNFLAGEPSCVLELHAKRGGSGDNPVILSAILELEEAENA